MNDKHPFYAGTHDGQAYYARSTDDRLDVIKRLDINALKFLLTSSMPLQKAVRKAAERRLQRLQLNRVITLCFEGGAEWDIDQDDVVIDCRNCDQKWIGVIFHEIDQHNRAMFFDSSVLCTFCRPISKIISHKKQEKTHD